MYGCDKESDGSKNTRSQDKKEGGKEKGGRKPDMSYILRTTAKQIDFLMKSKTKTFKVTDHPFPKDCKYCEGWGW